MESTRTFHFFWNKLDLVLCTYAIKNGFITDAKRYIHTMS